MNDFEHNVLLPTITALMLCIFLLAARIQEVPVKGVPPKMLPPLPTVTFPFLLAFPKD